VNHNPVGTFQKERNIWSRLTSHVNNTLLSKITGHEGNCWQVSSSQDLKTVGQASADDEHDNVLDFIFPRSTRTFTASSIGRERTEQAQDTTSHVKSIIADYCNNGNPDEIIGELQFCYISGMILGNLPCMEQWEHIVKIVFKSHQLAFDNPQFFVEFIDAVHAQLIYDEEGIDGSILDQDPSLAHDLRMILTIFKLRLNERFSSKQTEFTAAQRQVSKFFEDLESFLEKWNWDLKGNYVRSGKVGFKITCSLLPLCFVIERFLRY
jgi:A1 cistron-splicing factor AAR2